MDQLSIDILTLLVSELVVIWLEDFLRWPCGLLSTFGLALSGGAWAIGKVGQVSVVCSQLRQCRMGCELDL